MPRTTTVAASKPARPDARRVLLYARVSDTRDREDRLQSPDIQLTKIREAIAANHPGWRIVNDRDPFVELDESGADLHRPKLLEAVRLIEARQADVLAVYMLSRFARSTDATVLTKRIEAVGGEVISVSEPGLDGRTASGRFMRNIMFAVDEHAREIARAHRRNAREKAIRENKHLGCVPTGYRTEERVWDGKRKRWVNTGALVPDPVTAPVVTGIFERRANGESWAQIGKWVRSHGLIEPVVETLGADETPGTRDPGDWRLGRCPSNAASLRTIVGNRVYLGILRHGEFVREDAHEPLTDLLTFRRAHSQRGAQFADNGQKRVLSGLVRCAGCRSAMHVQHPSTRAAYYMCRNASLRPDVCAGAASIAAHTVEGYVLEVVKGEIRGRTRTLELASNESRLRELREAHRRAVALREEWESAEVQAITGDGWIRGLATRHENEQRSLRALLKAEEELIPTIAGFSPDELIDGLESMAFEEQQQVYRSLIETVFVRQTDRRGLRSRTNLEDRVAVLMAPYEVDLPQPGHRFDWRPFTW